MSVDTQFRIACIAFDTDVPETILSLRNILDVLANDLSRSGDFRADMGSAVPSVWPELYKLWRSTSQTAGKEMMGEFTSSLARFTRNLVAGDEQNQKRAFKIEPDVRKLIHRCTSWSIMQDEASHAQARLLAQTLANMVTANEPLLASLWSTYMTLPEEQVILIRLLASPDAQTVLTVLILITNCIHGSRERAKMLTSTAVGARICICLLDKMVALYDAEESSDGGKAFDVGYNIFTRLIEERLIPKLYARLSMYDEVITPHQTTLLKLLDSYLQSTSSSASVHAELAPLLSKVFFKLSEYAQLAIQKSLGPGSGPTDLEDPAEHVPPVELVELDVTLPKVCEALVLVTQCIVSVTLPGKVQDGKDKSGWMDVNDMKGIDSGRVDNSVLEKSGWIDDDDEQGARGDLRTVMNEVRDSHGVGLVEKLIELLRLLDVFLPRINFEKPVVSPAAHPRSTHDPTGFSYLKRDLVRLLGILCHANTAVQDRVRECGGIVVVMGLCIVDERNPYLREHAIFTLRNLLDSNEKNQAVVESIKPGTLEQNGE